jgi:hypothetical protein
MQCQQARWRFPCNESHAVPASVVAVALQRRPVLCSRLYSCIITCSHNCTAALHRDEGHHHAMLLPCTAIRASSCHLLPTSCHDVAKSCPAAQQGHDCFRWAKGRKAPLDRPSCCNVRKRTRKSCRHGSVISWSVTLHRSMGPRSIFQLNCHPPP